MLEVQKLDAYYGDALILQDIELQVARGERVSVVGRNGAGKSTLLKSIMNAGPRVDGTIKWDGEALNKMSTFRRARLGMALVPEDRRIFPHLTVAENLVISRYASDKKRGWLEPETLLKQFDMLAPLAGRMGNQLSGGQQQMLAIARGFASRPHLMFLDEPTEGLAPIIVEQLAQSITAACEREGIGLLLCEQNLRFAKKTTSKVFVIDNGRFVFSGDWAEFDRNPEIRDRHLAV